MDRIWKVLINPNGLLLFRTILISKSLMKRFSVLQRIVTLLSHKNGSTLIQLTAMPPSLMFMILPIFLLLAAIASSVTAYLLCFLWSKDAFFNFSLSDSCYRLFPG